MKKIKIRKIKRIPIKLSSALIMRSNETDEQFCDRVQQVLKQNPDDLDLQTQYVDCLLKINHSKKRLSFAIPFLKHNLKMII